MMQGIILLLVVFAVILKSGIYILKEWAENVNRYSPKINR